MEEAVAKPSLERSVEAAVASFEAAVFTICLLGSEQCCRRTGLCCQSSPELGGRRGVSASCSGG